MSIFVKYIYILRRPQNFGKSLHYILLSYVLPVQSKVKISQNFVAFSEYMNFKRERPLMMSDFRGRMVGLKLPQKIGH